MAMVADEGESVWLYLTAAGPSPTPIADCWLYNLVTAPTSDEVRARRDEYRAAGSPPPAPLEAISEEARDANFVDASDIQLVWSDDGESVAAWIRGQLIGFISAGERRGYSAFLLSTCPWGQPLQMAHYEKLFEA